MTSIRRLGALTLAAPLAVGITAFTPVAAAQAAGSGIKSPADNAVITDGATTTVTAHLALLATGDLYVRGPGSADRKIAGGIGPRDISGSVSISRNGAYAATLKGLLGTIDQQTFYVRVPPARPAGVDAGVSARKLVVRWDRGSEPDLTGYDVFLGGTEVRHGTAGGLCAGDVCSTSLSLPGSGGHTSVGVRARRSNGTGGTVASGISTTSVVLPSPVETSAVAPTPGALPSQSAQPLLPLTGKSPLSLPTVAPNGRQPGFQYPTPGPQVAEPVVGTNTSSDSASSPLRWAKSVALALILLVAAAHLGAWTRRLRLAQAVAMEPATATGKAAPAKRGPQTEDAAGLATRRPRGVVPAVSGRLIDAKGSAVDAVALLGKSGTSDRSSPEPADELSVMAASATTSTDEGKPRARHPKVDNRSDPRHSSGGYRGRRRAD